jgi:hypothetical protein
MYIVLLRSLLQFQVIANVPGSHILFTAMMEAIHFSETSVLTRATLRNIPEDGTLYSNNKENLKTYMVLTGWAP